MGIAELIFIIGASYTISGVNDDIAYERIQFGDEPHAEQQAHEQTLPSSAAEHLRKMASMNTLPQAIAARPVMFNKFGKGCGF